MADLLSDLDVAGATKEDLEDTEKQLTKHVSQVEKELGNRIHGVEKDRQQMEKTLRNLIERRHAEMKTYVSTRVLAAAGGLAVYLTILGSQLR